MNHPHPTGTQGRGGARLALVMAALAATLSTACLGYGTIVVRPKLEGRVPGTMIYEGTYIPRGARTYTAFGWSEHFQRRFQQAGMLGNMMASLGRSLTQSFAGAPLFHRLAVVNRGRLSELHVRGQAQPLGTTIAGGAPVHFMRVFFAAARTSCGFATCKAEFVAGVVIRRGLLGIQPAAGAAGPAGQVCGPQGRCYRPGAVVHRRSFWVRDASGLSAALAYKYGVRKLITRIMRNLAQVGDRLAGGASAPAATPAPAPPPPPRKR